MSPLTGAFQNSICGAKALEVICGVLVTIGLLCLEVTRRTVNAPRQDVSRQGKMYNTSYKKALQRYAPEALGLTACLVVAVVLRLRFSIDDVGDNATFQKILQQWPVLVTADTLLSLQAMLRLLVLISCALRMGTGNILISQEAAALSFGAALGRVLLLALTKSYMLDGPVALGGYLPAVCEVLSVPLLAVLCSGLRRMGLTISVLTLAIAAWIGYRNRLALANDALTDGLFIFAHTAELLAGFAYLSRALLSDSGCAGAGRGDVALRFAHVMMPLQQCLAAYYFIHAFEYIPAMVGSGFPFEILQMGGVAQLGAYAAAALLHLVESLEPSEECIKLGNAESADSHSSISAPCNVQQQTLPPMPRRIAVSKVL